MDEVFINLAEFMKKVIELVSSIVDIIDKTADMINNIEFIGGTFHEYLGYVRFVFGFPLWIMFTTVLLIPLGVTIWVYALKGIGYIKNLNLFT